MTMSSRYWQVKRPHIDLPKTVLILALLLLSKAFETAFAASGFVGNALGQLLTLIALGGLGYLIVRHAPGVIRFALRDKLLLLIAIYVPMTAFWSFDPQITLTRSIVFGLGIGIGFYIASRYSIAEQVNIYLWVFGLALLFSILSSILLPGIARLSTHKSWYDGAWLGIFPHKNALGRMMVIAAILFLLAGMQLKTRRHLWAAAIYIIALFVIYFSRSATSALVVFSCTLVIFLLRTLRSREELLFPLVSSASLLVMLPLLTLLLFNLNVLFDFFGRDATANTLFGRINLWQTVFGQIQQRFWLGYGYNAFWLGWEGPSAAIWLDHGWGPDHAHNGFFDLWLELGLVGLALIALHLLRSAGRAIRYLRIGSVPEAFWPISYLTFLLLANLTYSILFSNSIFFLILYVGTMLRTTYELKQVKKVKLASRTHSKTGALESNTAHRDIPWTAARNPR